MTQSYLLEVLDGRDREAELFLGCFERQVIVRQSFFLVVLDDRDRDAKLFLGGFEWQGSCLRVISWRF